MQRLILGIGAIMLAIPTPSSAQQALAAGGVTVLPRLVVTPLRRETALVRPTSSVTLIDEQELRKSAAADLPSLLKHYAGVSIIGYGGQGASSNVYLRGMSAGQTLVLVNGVRSSSATSGTSSIFNIPLSSIERIEIAKGPHSAQYGADAIGGVVNIITKQGGQCADGRNTCGSITSGVTHPWGGYLSGDLRGRTEDGIDYSVGGSILGTRGYDFTTPLAWGHEPDDDGFLQGSLNVAVAKEYGWGRLYADGLFARGRSQYDASPPSANEVDTDTFAGRIGARVKHSDSWSSTVELSGNLDYSNNVRDGVVGSSEFDTRRYGIFASTEKSFETGEVRHVLVGGAEAYREEVALTVDFGVGSRDLAAVFGQYSLDYGALTIDSGLRYDHNEQFGGATTYNIGASYELVPELVARASYGTGFRAPTFSDLYYPNYSNPNLKPEKSRSYEIGINWRPSEGTELDVAFYQTWLTDAIASNPPTYLPFNVARAKVTGIEASLSHAFDDRWSGKVSIDYRSPKNEDNGRYIPYRDRFKAAAEVSFAATDSLDLTAKLLYGAARYANAANTVKLPDYVTVDFAANYTVDERASLKFSVENLFDEHYSTVTNYRAPGRSFNLSFTRVF
ncbi:TonB-dependent receptor [Aminobacter sp. SS-2016]|uniref:TonB-dependent receptor domain-containing protein n=1 Tax=Aminobacter sp. Y103A TaxID=1870862 RepID=UPI00257314C4|nr:TonB-dependent receptor [Aminobacter sp. SS-2016]